MAKPTVIVVGADKGGVGKTTVSRTLLDYFTAHHVPTRAFDTESPKGTLKRFHPDISDIVDVTSVADQMRIFDTLSSTDCERHGDRRARRPAVADAAFAARHRLSRRGEEGTAHLRRLPHPRLLDRLAQRDRGNVHLRRRRQVFPGQELHQQHQLLRMGPGHPRLLFQEVQGRRRDHHSRSSTRWPTSRSSSPPFRSSLLSPTRAPKGEAANYSFVLRGYVRHWLGNVWGEYDRIKLNDIVATGGTAPATARAFRSSAAPKRAAAGLCRAAPRQDITCCRHRSTLSHRRVRGWARR